MNLALFYKIVTKFQEASNQNVSWIFRCAFIKYFIFPMHKIKIIGAVLKVLFFPRELRQKLPDQHETNSWCAPEHAVSQSRAGVSQSVPLARAELA